MSSQKPYHLHEIAKQLNGKLVQLVEHNVFINHILTDSRQLISPVGCLFFALVTSRNNGHKYIDELIEKGVRCFVVSELPEIAIETHGDLSFVVVKNTLAALQSLASWHRQRFSCPVIGITGSNGKTIVKEWLYQLFVEDIPLVRSPKSYNSQIGVPLSVWQLEPQHELAIFEAGISEPGEMENLQNIIMPTVGIFTNIGPAHDENFVHIEQKVGEKLKLFTKVDVLVYCNDHTEVRSGIIKSKLLQTIESFTWGLQSKNDLYVKQITKSHKETQIQAVYLGQLHEISIPFIDDASIENAMHCWCIMIIMGVEHSKIFQKMKLLTPIAMRLELKEGINDCILINDCYNSDIHSLAIALDFLNQQNKHRNKLVILSDILESGWSEVELYGQIAELLIAKGVDKLIGVGKAISRQASRFQVEKQFFETTEAFIASFSPSLVQNNAVLIKGARIFEFERISTLLQQKAHETVLEINLNNLIFNLNIYRSTLTPGTKIMLMVKAFGYGSGSFEIANALQFHHVDYLAVAYSDEGIELRKAGVTVPIMVMSPEEDSFDAMLKYDLEPEIFSIRILNMLEAAIQRHNLTYQKVKVHLKIDTGMRRLGFDEKDIPELIMRLASNPALVVQSVFSHLAASENPEHYAFTMQQIASFEAVCQKLETACSTPFLRHILNSAGISRFRHAHFEMVRLGIGVYGVPIGDWEKEKLQHVLSLKSTVTQIKEVPEGESVGYNRSSYTTRNSKIGVVPIGYADGLPRALSNGKGKLFVRGLAAPIVGDVCMDMCMIDLTFIEAEEGDEVIIFDQNHSIVNLSNDAGTIPYEILTRISRRVKRVYFQE